MKHGRLIDADEIPYIQAINESFEPTGEFYARREDIAAMPTIEPERKKGKWERHYSRPNVYADLYWHCSECGYKNDDQYANIYHKFCPRCGSDMRGDSDN